ncbi:MAG: DUF4380 domain-containing protein [Fimbriimonadaceae bacterium]|nr:DUF4380 domain-containing protein [Fimbriimonadaceae bacterium]
MAVSAILLMGALASAPTSPVPVSVEMGVWRGRDSVTLDNGILEMIVVPSISRVMVLRRKGAHNVLFSPGEPETVGAWINYGGDKVWSAPQSNWGWPPEPAFDPGPATLTLIENGVRLTSPINAKTGLVVIRDVLLEPGMNRARFINRLENRADEPRSASPWQVMQIAHPAVAVMNLEPGAQPPFYNYQPEGPVAPYHLHDARRNTLTLMPMPKVGRKFGSFGPAIDPGLTALTPTDVITMNALQTTADDRNKSLFPDEGSRYQVYISPTEGRYTELEAAGPVRPIPPGGTATQTIVVRVTAR